MLIIFGGLPGSGKSTIAKNLALQIGAVYLRIDTIEMAMCSVLDLPDDIGPAGYVIANKVALDNLRLGLRVIGDAVNPIEITRSEWRSIAQQANASFFEVEIICSDKAEHQRRVETRKADISGHQLPTWKEVIDRNYEPWDTAQLVLDTALLSVDECVAKIIESISAE